MNDEDKKEHFYNVVKSINNICFNKCFKPEECQFDNDCAKICYEKYIFSIGRLNNFLKEIGRKTNSEFATKAYQYGINERKDILFPPTGSDVMHGFIIFRYYPGVTDYSKIGKNEFKPTYFWS